MQSKKIVFLILTKICLMNRLSFYRILFVSSYLIISSQTNAQISLNWASTAGAASSDEGISVAVDSNKYIYTCGHFSGTVDFDSSPSTVTLTSLSSSRDIFICKYDSTGSLIWAKQLTNTGSGVCTVYESYYDPNGFLYLSGSFNSSTTDFDPSTGTANLTAGYTSLFIAKYDLNGDYIWAEDLTPVGSTSSPEIYALKGDSEGNIYLCGRNSNTLDFDPGSGTSYVIGKAGFFAKYDASGNYKWVKQLSAGSLGGSSVCAGIDIDTLGNVYVTGSFYNIDPIDFDPGPGTHTLTNIGYGDIYFAKYDSLGNFLWVVQVSGPDGEGGSDIFIDQNNNIILVGTFSDSVDFDPTPASYWLTAVSSPEIFFTKYTQTGNLLWAQHISTGNNDPISCIDEEGSLYITSDFHTSIDLDPSAGTEIMTANGGSGTDIYITKYDTYGNFIWGGNIGDSGGTSDYSRDIAVKNTLVLLTGLFQTSAEFDPSGVGTYLPSNGYLDYFVADFSQLICSPMNAVIDSAVNVTCASTGFATSFAYGGTQPYHYSWNTSPPIADSNVVFNGSGIYTLTVSDSFNFCSVQKHLLVNGPTTFSTDLMVNAVSGSFRPGLTTTIFIDALNLGCNPSSGNVYFVLDNRLSLDSSTITPFSISGDSIIWTYTGLTYDSTHFKPIIYVKTDSLAVIGDTICFTIMITPFSGDTDTNNNIRHYCLPVINAFDPNTKSVYPIGICDERYVLNTQKLTYTLQFQNTGTADALNVNILDSISNNLDMNSVRVISSSHYEYTEVLPGNVLKFHFPNIHLPDSSSNEVASHGYIIFDIDPISGLINGSNISNTAYIYFDFNTPVVTNTTSNTIINILSACGEESQVTEAKSSPAFVKVYPNPVDNELNIIFSNSSSADITLTDMTGHIVMHQTSNSQNVKLQTNTLEAGVYCLTIRNGNETMVTKVIKE